MGKIVIVDSEAKEVTSKQRDQFAKGPNPTYTTPPQRHERCARCHNRIGVRPMRCALCNPRTA